MPRVAKFGRRKDKKTNPVTSPHRKRAKTAGSDELDCLSKESVIGLQNGINIPHLGDKMLPPCVSPDKIDDETEVNVGGVTKETVINDSIFSQTALYRTSKPLIEHLQKSIHELMLIGYGGSIHSEKKWGQKRTEQFISHVFIRLKTLFEIPTAVPTSGLDTIMVDSAVNYLSSLQVSGTNFTANEYLRTHILESLVSSEVSNRILATRLGVNRKLLPDIIERRRSRIRKSRIRKL
jgi:hypothetical protein